MNRNVLKPLLNRQQPILITGHTGFKGTWLTLLLAELNIPVVGYSLAPETNSLFDRANRSGAIPELFSDIRDFAKLDSFIQAHQPFAIIHLAAQPLVLESYRTPRYTFDVNVMGTVNLLDSAFSCGSVKAIVAATTDKVYRNDETGVAFVESDPLTGKDPYSASKVGTEAAVSAWQQIAEVSRGPKVISVRAGNVIGGGDWADDRLLPDLLKSFIAGTPFSVRNPASTRPWQHVLDPLSGYLLALAEVLNGCAITSVNFGPDSKSLSVSEVVALAQKNWPKDSFIDAGGASELKNAEAANLQIDSQFALKTLGWAPHWTQEEAVASTLRWWDKVVNQRIHPVAASRADIEWLLDK